MKTKILSLSALTLGFVLTASCGSDTPLESPVDTSNDIRVNPDAPAPAGTTEFGYRPSTRTTGIYSGSAVDFYWTLGDNLWVNRGGALPDLVKSSTDNIAAQLATSGDTKAPGARFFFQGTYMDNSYPVRYTGKGSTAGDRVTIATTQTQPTPNDARHIGESGDCGTATATRQPDGSFSFMIDHQASYLTFVPYYPAGFANSVVLTQIKVTADLPIAGTYAFSDTGLAAAPHANSSNSITLNLKSASATEGFPVPAAAAHATNAAILVLAPGTYSTLTVEYTLYDADTQVTGTVTRTYNNLTLNAGRNRKVAADLQLTNYPSNGYYMWDAAVGQHYWAGYENVQPALTNNSDPNYPKTATDARWYNTAAYPAQASRSCAGCPNVNELFWYAQRSAPCWDASTPWVMSGHLYKGGMWFKKLAVIAAENNKTLAQMKNAAPNGVDYRVTPVGVVSNTSITQGKPANTTPYFYLPALGMFQTGKLEIIGINGTYWTSSTSSTHPEAFLLGFNQGIVNVNKHPRTLGARLWTAQ